jgi:hypothetical protein
MDYHKNGSAVKWEPGMAYGNNGFPVLMNRDHPFWNKVIKIKA